MPSTGSNQQILIVDRDVASVKPLRQRLSAAGFIVRAITDGGAAVAAVAGRPPNMVIMDWNIRGCAALELIQGLRRVWIPEMRLIILSALAAEQDVVTGLNLGADDYIAKPYSLREVVARVLVIMHARRTDDERKALYCDELILDAAANRVTTPIFRRFAGSDTGLHRPKPDADGGLEPPALGPDARAK